MGEAGEEMRGYIERNDKEALDEVIASLQEIVEEAEGAAGLDVLLFSLQHQRRAPAPRTSAAS